MARIDHDNAHLAFLLALYQIANGAAAAHSGFSRIIAEKHNQLAVGNIGQVIAAVPGAVCVIHSVEDLGGAVRVVVVELSAQYVHQAIDLVTRRDHSTQVTGAVDTENRLIAIGIDYLSQFA